MTENRGIQINSGSNNYSALTYDGLGRNVQIQEYSGGTLTSTKQFLWADGYRREARNSGGSITAQYFLRGKAIAGNDYFLTGDHLGSIREMTDSSGNIKAQYSYDPYGRVTQIQGSMSSDFQFASYYEHAPSGLNLTRTRAYTGALGRFINRDPDAESAGLNLFNYVLNNPQTAFGKLEAALKLEPNYVTARENLSIAHSNYAFELRRTNKQEALRHFHIAQYLNEGNAFQATNVKAMIKLIGMNPDNVADRLLLAESAKSNHDSYGAVEEYRAALQLKNDSQTHKKLGDVYRLLNVNDKAAAEYAAATKVKK